MESKENIRALVMKRARQWLDSNIDEQTANGIRTMMEKDEEGLIESFYRHLEFGTGGLRGIMGPGTNRMNIYTVGMATQGLCNYLKSFFSSLEKIKVVIGHDNRNNSRKFAETAAKIFSANGINVFMFDSLRPTPELSFAIRELGCQSGVMITASHNPKEYNGYKVYWDDGGQIIHPHDRNIIEEVNRITDIGSIDFNGNEKLIENLGEDFDRRYIEKLCTLSLSPEAIARHNDIRIVYTPIHGTGVRLVPQALEKFGFNNIMHIPEQDITDGDFPTVISPNPEEPAALSLALQKAENAGAELIMGTDPDADRVGIAVPDPEGNMVLLNGNQTAALLIYYLIRKWAEQGRLKGKEYIVKTIVTTELLSEISNHYGVEHYDVLTGFKYIADVINKLENKKQFIAGAEESYGYLAGDFIRDKDAVMSCALIAETAAWARDNGKSLFELLLEIYSMFGLYREKLISVFKEGKSGAEEIRKMMHAFRTSPPEEIKGCRVIQILDYQQRISLDTITGKSSPIDLPESNVLQFILDDGTRISIRPSGTEPKIKFYFSTKTSLGSTENFDRKNRELEKEIDRMAAELQL